MRLVYLSPVPWASFAQRPHMFVEWFHTTIGGDVQWLDPYPTRFPLLSDLHRLGQQDRQENSTSPTWLKVIRPAALPVEPLPWSGWVNALVWRKVIEEITAFAHQQTTLLVFGKPSVLALAVMHSLNNSISVYDAMDDFPSFYSGLSRMAIRRRERELIGRATHVLASSTALKLRWGNVRSDVQLVPNGLDASVLPDVKFGKPARERKILGYVGTIGPWFDWEWLIHLAKCQPNNIVRLIGPIYTHSKIELPNNIEIEPSCQHKEAMEKMLDFDAGLIPFKINELTYSVDPIKYYEYKALGLPVISTNFGEMSFRALEQGVFLSFNKNDIPYVCKNALAYIMNFSNTKIFRNENSWSTRFDSINII
jgi:glycosyltransferase involved in cell wall biosynthesis